MADDGYFAISAGPLHWNGIREMAAHLGLTCTESRGWLTRHFVLRGDSAALSEAHAHIADYVARKSGT